MTQRSWGLRNGICYLDKEVVHRGKRKGERMPVEDTCLIWGEGVVRKFITDDAGEVFWEYRSHRAGGTYRVPEEEVSHLQERLQQSDVLRVIVSKEVYRRNRMGEVPVLSEDLVQRLAEKPMPRVSEKVQCLMWFIYERCGDRANAELHLPMRDAMAAAGVLDAEELHFLLKHLRSQGWIEGGLTSRDGETFLRLTVAGHSYIEQLDRCSKQAMTAFICQHDGIRDEAVDEAIHRAVETAGYYPVARSERHESDDATIAELRRSRFVIAEGSMSASVPDETAAKLYYQAGMARGMDIPTIWTCKAGEESALCGLGDRYPVVWSTPEELYEGLCNRVRALLGQGPLRGWVPEKGKKEALELS